MSSNDLRFLLIMTVLVFSPLCISCSVELGMNFFFFNLCARSETPKTVFFTTTLEMIL